MDQNTLTLLVADPPARIIIRPMERTDLPALEWEGEFIHFRRVFEDVYNKVEKGLAKSWVAVTDQGFMVGQVFLQLSSDRHELADGWNRAYLYSFRIRPEFQNKGIGTRIYAEIEKTLQQMDFKRITLNVARDNQGAIRLYNRLGFQIVAEEPGVWSFPDHLGQWRTYTEPSWRMEKRLPDPME